MAVIHLMKNLWRCVYGILTIWGMVLFLPSMIIIFPLLFLVAVVEFILLDLPWLFAISITEGVGRLKDNIFYLSLL